MKKSRISRIASTARTVRRCAAAGLTLGLLIWSGFAQAAQLTVLNNADSGAGSLRQAIADAAPGDEVIFDPALNGQTITLTSGPLRILTDLVVTGPGADQLAISGNHAYRVFFVDATVTLSGLTIRDGDAAAVGYDGGGILFYHPSATLTVKDCAITGNVTGATGNGGGIHVRSSGTLTVIRSTVSGNSARTGHGGGIHAASGPVNLINSTVSGNTAVNGGGIYTGPASTLNVINSTVARNEAFSVGGGIHSENVTLKNSLVAGNLGTAPGIYSVAPIVSNGANFIGTTTGFPGGAQPTDLTFATTGVSLAALLGDLAANGGPTMTHALPAGSPAINGGLDSDAPSTTDQRGLPRRGTVDIGAFEFQPPNQPPIARCQNVVVDLAGPSGPKAGAASCAANALVDDGSSDPDGDEISITQSPRGPYPIGVTEVTLTVTDSNGASSTCVATVTVRDVTAPLLDSDPRRQPPTVVYLECGEPVPAAVSPLYLDCSSFTVTYADTAPDENGSFTRQFVATDVHGNANSLFSQAFHLVDGTAPAITLIGEPEMTVSCEGYTEPGATALDACAGVLTAGIVVSGTVDATTPGDYLLTYTVSDPSGNIAQTTRLVHVVNSGATIAIDALTTSTPILAVGNTASVTVTFATGATTPQSVTYDWGDGTQSATGTHVYTAPGVYSVTVTASAACGTATQTLDYIVAYDPTAGFVTGGGWINSPAGAAAWNPALIGRANFGFVAKYKKGQSIPTGETEFQFKAGDLNFKSATYQWLVVSGARAQYKGVGTINGVAGYSFLLTAIDGQLTGGGGADKFRIKIWDTASSTILYDNQPGADDSATPTTLLGGGSIVIHK